ncbi:MAG: hypothetical protein FJ385_02710 [Verrucomicrobia bacterium]|nr:hypothetical protein [Verrucomicrobiota bacterium]
MRVILPASVLLLAAALLAPQLSAEESKLWTLRREGTFKGTLQDIGNQTVSILREDTQAKIEAKIEDLSLADRQYLIQSGRAPEDILFLGKPEFVEKDLQLNKAEIKAAKQDLEFSGTVLKGYEIAETPRFFVAAAGKVKPEPTIEMLERVWHAMAFNHIGFRDSWGTQRMPLLLISDPTAYREVIDWYLEAIRRSNPEAMLPPNWVQAKEKGPDGGAANMGITGQISQQYNVRAPLVVFGVSDLGAFKESMEPGRLFKGHIDLMSHYLGQAGNSAFSYGQAYYRTQQTTGASGAWLVSIEGTSGVAKTIQVFKGSWAKGLQKAVKSGRIEDPKADFKVALAPMLRWRLDELGPERLGLMYSLASYAHSNQKRLVAYSRLLEAARVAGKPPGSADIATAFAFASADAFQADWNAFINESPDFK